MTQQKFIVPGEQRSFLKISNDVFQVSYRDATRVVRDFAALHLLSNIANSMKTCCYNDNETIKSLQLQEMDNSE